MGLLQVAQGEGHGAAHEHVADHDGGHALHHQDDGGHQGAAPEAEDDGLQKEAPHTHPGAQVQQGPVQEESVEGDGADVQGGAGEVVAGGYGGDEGDEVDAHGVEAGEGHDVVFVCLGEDGDHQGGHQEEDEAAAEERALKEIHQSKKGPRPAQNDGAPLQGLDAVDHSYPSRHTGPLGACRMEYLP